MDDIFHNIDPQSLTELKDKLISACIEKQCFVEDEKEELSIDMYSGEGYSRQKMISFLNKLDIRRSENPNIAIYFVDYIADRFPDQAPYCMARIISTFKQMNKPKLGIARSYYYFKKYDNKIFSSEMFVALGAAFRAIDEIAAAKTCTSLANLCDTDHTNSEYIHNLCYALEKYKDYHI